MIGLCTPRMLYGRKIREIVLVRYVELPDELRMICARLVIVLIAVALCGVRLYNDWSSSHSVCVGSVNCGS